MNIEIITFVTVSFISLALFLVENILIGLWYFMLKKSVVISRLFLFSSPSIKKSCFGNILVFH